MARIAGVDLPNKHVEIALTYIFGIGRTSARKICDSTKIDPAKKIGVIKVVRELTGLGLKESKDLVEGAPKTVKENVDKKTADEMNKKLTEAGGVVELK